MTFRSTTMFMTVGTAVVVMVTINAKPAPLLIWNASQSVPIGLYRLQPADQFAVADLVVATPEEPLPGFLAERGYPPFGVPLIKHILAAPGQPSAGTTSSSWSTESRWGPRASATTAAANFPRGRAAK